MEESTVTHISPDTKYRVSFEQSATKGVIGFKVETHGDDAAQTLVEAVELMESALKAAKDNAEES